MAHKTLKVIFFNQKRCKYLIWFINSKQKQTVNPDSGVQFCRGKSSQIKCSLTYLTKIKRLLLMSFSSIDSIKVDYWSIQTFLQLFYI